MLVMFLGHFLALCIGLSLGLMGGGGSILAVPILVYVMGIPTKTAIAMSLAIVGTVSLISLIPHWRQGNVRLPLALVFAPTAMLGAYLGARLAGLPQITDTVQLMAFALVMLVASLLMIRKSRGTDLAVTTPAPPPSAVVGTQTLWILIQGLVVGVLTGFVGVGGGFLIVPAFVLLLGVPMKHAIGTSLLIIAFNSAAGFVGYLNQVVINWGLMISFTVVASLGTLIGAYLTRYIDARHLQRGFGYFVLAIAVFVLIKR
jgi:uncharacterized membrane protein YfcA